MEPRKQGSTDRPIPILLVSSSDHVTPVTGATVTVTLSKDGGAFVAAAGAITERGNGVYWLAGNATDRNTLGALVVYATAAGADPFHGAYTIVPWDPFNGMNLGVSALPDATAGGAGGLPLQDATGAVLADVRFLDGHAPDYYLEPSSGQAYLAVNVQKWTGGDAPGLLSESGVQSALTSQGYTVARAGRLENLDAAITTRLAPTVAGRTLDVAVTGEAGVDFSNLKQATSATTLNNITVPVVTSLSNAPADPAGVTTLLARLTDVRAGYLDKLNVAGTLAHSGNADLFQADVSGLLTAAAYTTPDNAGIAAAATTAARLNTAMELDGAVYRFTTQALEQAPAGGGSGGGFNGSRAVTLNFRDAAGHPVPGVIFAVAGVGAGATDASGSITLGLNDGQYTIRASPQSGVLWPETAITVVGDGTFNLDGQDLAITPAADPGQSTGYLILYDRNGNPAAAATLEYRLVEGPGADGASYPRTTGTTPAADANGLLAVTLVRGGRYQFRRDLGPWVEVMVSDAATTQLPEILGRYTPGNQ
jgi:hypothetical protein